MSQLHHVYMLECVNDSYYTGYTTDLSRRYKEHQKGTKKCRYTRSFPPKQLIAYWSFATKSEALRFEHFLKSKSRSEKEAWIVDSHIDSFKQSQYNILAFQRGNKFDINT